MKLLPGSLTLEVLTVLVARPGLDAGAIARAVELRRRPAPATLSELRAQAEAERQARAARHKEWGRVQAQRRVSTRNEGWQPPPITLARTAQERAFRDEVSAALRALVRGGLVEPAGPVQLDPLALEAWRRDGAASLARREHIEAKGVIVGVELVAADPALVAVVEVLAEGPMTQRALAARTGGLTPAGRIGGAWLSRYDALVDDGVILPPGDRWPTEAGRALIVGAGPAVAAK
ncbi:MAG: hypothetical protein JNM72_26425 [Deltaproteobacteria bacterium]|nr:hypothetical protein [Deltaproteobacteria bacterium]